MPEVGPPGSKRDPSKPKDDPFECNISPITSFIVQFEMAYLTEKLSVLVNFSSCQPFVMPSNDPHLGSLVLHYFKAI